MQIQLKQNEIEQALKQYITKQGISLANQNVGISFTAGRKNGGLLADITIDDLGEIPGLSGDAPSEVKPALTLVIPTPAPEPAPWVEADPVPEPAVEVAAEAAAPKTATASLFS